MDKLFDSFKFVLVFCTFGALLKYVLLQAIRIKYCIDNNINITIPLHTKLVLGFFLVAGIVLFLYLVFDFVKTRINSK